MRVLGVALALAVTAVVTGTAASMPAKDVSLTITYWADEQQGASTFTRWTLRCSPVGGTLPTRKRACAKLSGMGAGAFAQVPPNVLCTEIYGGPNKAVVKGTLGTQRIWASFRRRNGCEIGRWDRFSPWLLPSAAA